MDFKFIAKKAAIGGGIVGAIMFVITLLSAIPFVGCFIGFINIILIFTPAILTAYLIEKERGTITILDSTVAGSFSALVAGFILGIATIISTTFLVGTSSAGANEIGGIAGGAAIGAMSGILFVFIAICIMIAINAVVGAIYGLIKNH